MLVNKMIHIIIPAYNEEKNIRRCIEGVHKYLKNKKYIINLINDGSKDKTLQISKQLAKKFPIKTISHKINQGVAEVFKTGIQEVVKSSKKGDVAIIMEGDATSDPLLLNIMIKKIKGGKDIVIASRYLKGGGYRNFPLKRLILSLAANSLLRRIFPLTGLRDYTIFYRGYNTEIIKKVAAAYGDKLITTKYFAANAELLIKMLKYTNQVEEIPFIYDYGQKHSPSNLKILKNIKQYLKFISRLRYFF